MKVEKNYPIISRKCSDGAKATFLKDFENYENEQGEILEHDIKKCYNHDPQGQPTTPKTAQGKIAETLLDLKKTRHTFSLFGATSDLECFLIPGLDISKIEHAVKQTNKQTNKQKLNR